VKKKAEVIDYKSEDSPALVKTKVDRIEVRSGEEKIQENYKTSDQALNEDYEVSFTRADKQKVKEREAKIE